MTMSKIPALSQKVLAEWLRMPERQELFPGLPQGASIQTFFLLEKWIDVSVLEFY